MTKEKKETPIEFKTPMLSPTDYTGWMPTKVVIIKCHESDEDVINDLRDNHLTPLGIKAIIVELDNDKFMGDPEIISI